MRSQENVTFSVDEVTTKGLTGLATGRYREAGGKQHKASVARFKV